jgi:hypothetical protein
MGIAGRSTAVLIATLLAALPVRSVAQEPSLEDVLARVARYVTDFHTKLSGIVAEEHYRQEIKHIAGRTSGAGTLPRQTLTSDLLLVRPPDSDRYVEFRDVFEVNGTPVRDRDKRLEKLFLKPTATTFDQIRDIVDESARHNIGNIPRNINTPMLALHFLQEHVQRRFRFKRAASGRPELGNPAAIPRLDPALFRVTTEMWVLEYKETSRPTIIKTNHGRDFAATGRFWVNPDTGAVLMSELVMSNSEVNAVIDVSYQSESLLGFMVPAEMRERYRGGSDRVEGVATYGRFRQFQVKTGEAIIKPPGTLQ